MSKKSLNVSIPLNRTILSVESGIASHGVRSIDTLRRWLRLDSEEKLNVGASVLVYM